VTKQHLDEESLISYASHFDLIESEDNFLLHFRSPESGNIELRFFLTKEAEKSKKGYTTISLPSSRLITLSGTSIGMLATLKEQERIVGVSNKGYVYDKQTLKGVKQNQIIEVGEESNLPLEKIIQTQAQLILYSGFGSNFPGSQKLNTLGIKSIPIYDWRETHPLGKAEWIKLFGVLTNKLETAKHYFNEIESKYLELQKTVKLLNHTPTVLSGNLLGDIWYAPNGNSFVAQILKDAHVSYKYQNSLGTGSTQLSLERVIKDNTHTDYWINPGFSSSDAILELNPKLTYIGPLKNNTYCYSHNMNLFWERSAIEPHRILSDFIQIFHPELNISDSLYFYKNINE
jgi:iron complex transport system substrate-binding protein